MLAWKFPIFGIVFLMVMGHLRWRGHRWFADGEVFLPRN